MKIVVSVCVYDRFENIREWLRCWRLCDINNAELVIIHNCDIQEQSLKFKGLCDSHSVRYILRKNTGFDIGAFMDVCQNKLKGFPDYDYLLWCTDDTIPMRRDFISPFLNKFKNNIGVVCIEMSTEVKLHFRTTGFMIKKETAEQLKFPDKITTKDDCYQMEHRGRNSFYNQIVNMGLRVLMVDKPEQSPMYDTGYLKRQREGEHYAVFPTTDNKKILFICPIYNSYPQIISSLICQTHHDWELVLIHDGKNKTNLISHITDPRIKYIETKDRVGNWGHSLRKWALNELNEGRLSTASYVVISNADNYHVPSFCEFMLAGFTENKNAVATYCEKMVHSYIGWDIIDCKPERGFIDCAGVMVKRSVAGVIGWRDEESHSSDWTYFEDIINKYGIDKWIKIKGALLTHN